MLDGRLDARDELRDHGIFVCRIHRVRATDHDDELDFQVQVLETVDHFGDFRGIGRSEVGNLHDVHLDG